MSAGRLRQKLGRSRRTRRLASILTIVATMGAALVLSSDALQTGATFATSSVTTVASDANGTLVLLYSGSTAVGGSGHVYVRRSTDSGATWSARTEMTTSAGGADATSVAEAGRGNGTFRITTGAAYKTANGFSLPYGDYDTLTINSAGKTVAVMGEGDTSQLHGDIWVNRQT